MKTFVIGDIHGCINELMQLMHLILGKAKSEDTIVFLGDYIDRGPHSDHVIEYLIELKKKSGVGGFPKIIVLMGNHEDMFCDWCDDSANQSLSRWYFENGAVSTLTSYRDNEQIWRDQGKIMRNFLTVKGNFAIPNDHVEFIKELPEMYVDDRGIYVHAGLIPRVELEHQPREQVLWIRHDFIFSTYDWGKRVFFGHSPQKNGQPLVEKNKVGIDTACVYKGKLTCAVVDDDQSVEFLQVDGYHGEWPTARQNMLLIRTGIYGGWS